MPALMIETIEFDETMKSFYISLRTLAEVLPNVQKGNRVQISVVEVRDQSDRLVIRFKPFRQLKLKISDCLDGSTWRLALFFSEDEAFDLNLASNYRIALIITEINEKSVFPFELKTIGYYQPEKVLECFSSIESKLLVLSIKQPILGNAVSYLYDSHARLKENDVEGARTSLRKALETIGKFASTVVPLNEANNFRDNLKKLTKDLAAFVHYGGPHPGPTPRSSTEMILEISVIYINYLARAIENKTIKIEESSN